jgi:hypothetical protein
MESETTQQFFDAGLRSYSKALLAIYEFKGLLEDELQNVMAAQPPGSTLKLAAEPGFSISAGLPPNSPYFAVVGTLAQPANDLAGAVATTGRLTVGVWWTPPFPSATGAAVYAGVSGVPWAKKIVKPDGFDGLLYRTAFAYLTRDVMNLATFGTVVGELLGYLDGACKKAQDAFLLVGASENR